MAPERAPAATAPDAPGVLSLADVRRMWPDVLERVKQRRRFTWILLSQNAQVIGFDGSVLTVGLKNAGARESFVGGGSDEVLREAVRALIGVDWRVEAVVDPSADPDAGAPRVVRPAVPGPDPSPADAAGEGPADSRLVATPAATSRPAAADDPSDGAPDWAAPRAAARPESLAQARSNIAPTRQGDAPSQPTVDLDAGVDRDDPDVDDTGLDGKALLERELGAVVIEEFHAE